MPKKEKEDVCIIMETGYVSEDWIMDSSAMPIQEAKDEEEDDLSPL